jgi:hypothetical protein
MSFTRFHDDPYRIQKQVTESAFPGNYMINTPGPGMNLPFMEDTGIRMQKWGANLCTNTVNLESDLRGMTRKLNRDLIGENDYRHHSVQTNRVPYRETAPFIEETRASHPAWMYRDIEHQRWEEPLLNPLNGFELKFHNNIQTRILEKDYFVQKTPVVSGYGL